jgi:hypothetical protein
VFLVVFEACVMSHLTASPWHKPSPYEFTCATQPLSSPETDSDHVGLPNRPYSLTGVHSNAEFVDPSIDPETPASRLRRVSTLAYHHPGFQKTRAKGLHKNSKTLVVVIPPPVFFQDRGQLGTSLSLGPRDRACQGILMPLFPTVSPLSSVLPPVSNIVAADVWPTHCHCAGV